MKSQIILQNNNRRGFLLAEAMLAFSLLSMFMISSFTLSSSIKSLHSSNVKGLLDLKASVLEMDFFLENNFASSTEFTQNPYGNDTSEVKIGVLTSLVSDFENAWGRDSCNPRLSYKKETSENEMTLYSQGVYIGSENISTDIEVRHGTVYLSADSSSGPDHDIFIINSEDRFSPQLISSLDTGPGVLKIEVAGPYIYAANAGSTNQLQVIDIHDRPNPILLSRFKLPLPNASSTAPKASSIFYSKGIIYLGTEKWEGQEFAVIDVVDPSSPKYLGGFETDTLVTDIYVRGGFAYLAASDEGQLRILDIRNSQSISQVEYFSPSGWQTQEGKSVSYFENMFLFGRTTGGFNIPSNPEIFIFSENLPLSINYSKDIPGGSYGSIMRPENIFIITRFLDQEFQVWKSDLSEKITDISLGFIPRSVACDDRAFYFATGDERGMALLSK